MGCPSCGTVNEPGSRFCGSCGARQPEVVPSAPAPVSAGSGAALLRPRRTALWVLLALDAALALGGVLLLRAGLASPASAAVVESQKTSSAEVGGGAASPAQAMASPVVAPAPAPPPAASAVPAVAAASAEPAVVSIEPAAEPAPPPPDPAPKAGSADGSKRKKARKSSSSKERRSDDAPLDPYDASLQELVDRAFASSQKRFSSCFSAARAAEPGIGKVVLTVTFSVLADSVGRVSLQADGRPPASLAPCVQSVLATWKLRAPRDGESSSFTRRLQFNAP